MREGKNGKVLPNNLTAGKYPTAIVVNPTTNNEMLIQRRRRKILCISYLQSVYLKCILMAPLSGSESQALPVCFIIVPLPKRMLQAFEYACCESIPILNVDTILTTAMIPIIVLMVFIFIILSDIVR
jgi:hypothetical protein